MTNPIAEKNDAFRKAVLFSPQPDGKAMMTQRIADLGKLTCLWLYREIANFDAFEEGNDPYGEHDFGSFTISVDNLFTGEAEKRKVIWKIDYWEDETLQWGTEDKLNCYRILTIMFIDEY